MANEVHPSSHEAPPAEALRNRVLVVDDHPIVRQGLARLVNREEDLMVCAEAGDGAEAMRALARTKPHIVLMDISLGKDSGIELTRIIHSLQPSLPVLAISMHDEPSYVSRALAAGAQGYVTKQDDPDTVLVAIRSALAGVRFISHDLAGPLSGN